ncbi:UDP-N-acetylglucosamine 4,6-dehydratase [Candidatus Magnetoovum chiemensis]|nr:UDP-N-acetylglucosamine 4,6-dehydratase [Candidatus Magnetoovum chiemensis]
MFNNKTLLITGGTGTFGRNFTRYVLNNYSVNKLIVFSRDEFKQYEMSFEFPTNKYPIRYFLGDIRDKERLFRAFDGVDYVVHSAALKQVTAAEYNPFKAVKTNIIGAQNIVEAAIDNGVKKVIALSTDKAVSPINLYGATKLAMEKLFVSSSAYVGARSTKFCVVRYGNVIGSRGSVLPFFLNLFKNKTLEFPVTDDRMTRFWITIQEAIEFVTQMLEYCMGGEVFIPKIPSMKVTDLVKAISERAYYKIIGIRVGEKIHETLLTGDEAGTALECSYSGRDFFVVLPDYHLMPEALKKYKRCSPLPEDFNYRSDTNSDWISVEQMRAFINQYKKKYEM